MFEWETSASAGTLWSRGSSRSLGPGKDAVVHASLTPHPHPHTRAHARDDASPPPWAAVFEALPVAALVLRADGRVAAVNAAAAALVGPRARQGARCCDVLACRVPGGDGCLTRLVRSAGGPVERRVELAGGPARLTAVPVPDAREVVVALTAVDASEPDEPAAASLRLIALGRTRLELDGRPLDADWLGHRPGLVLKYLASERGRAVPLEELLEVFWPTAGRTGASSVRQAVHTLRDHLEPGRTRGLPSAFVVARQGGYALAAGRVQVDADDFEAHARAGLRTLGPGPSERAVVALEAAADAYGGDFLADEPYADWALAERERLCDVAAQVLRALAEHKRAAGDLDGAATHLQRLADLEPLDLVVQRELIGSMLQRGRHSEAFRRFELVRRRYKRAFGEEPGFSLGDVAAR
jgi:DNA-binding SARP family transcriptional activator